MIDVRPGIFGFELPEFTRARHLCFPNEGRSLRYQDQEQSGPGFVRGEMVLCYFVLLFAGRAVDHRDLVFLCPGTQTPAEAPRHAHQMVVVEIGIGTVQLAPPYAQSSASLPHPKLCVQSHAVDTVVAAFEKITIKG